MVATRTIMPKPRKLQNVLYLLTKKALNEKFSDKDDVALFRKAKQIRKQNQDIIGEKCVKDDNKLAFSDTTKKNAWK